MDDWIRLDNKDARRCDQSIHLYPNNLTRMWSWLWHTLSIANVVSTLTHMETMETQNLVIILTQVCLLLFLVDDSLDCYCSLMLDVRCLFEHVYISDGVDVIPIANLILSMKVLLLRAHPVLISTFVLPNFEMDCLPTDSSLESKVEWQCKPKWNEPVMYIFGAVAILA